jgi:hypothetical protein
MIALALASSPAWPDSPILDDFLAHFGARFLVTIR